MGRMRLPVIFDQEQIELRHPGLDDRIKDVGTFGEGKSMVSAHPLLLRELKSLQRLCATLAVVATTLGVSTGLLIGGAHAQANPPKPIEDAKKAIETLIN